MRSGPTSIHIPFPFQALTKWKVPIPISDLCSEPAKFSSVFALELLSSVCGWRQPWPQAQPQTLLSHPCWLVSLPLVASIFCGSGLYGPVAAFFSCCVWPRICCDVGFSDFEEWRDVMIDWVNGIVVNLRSEFCGFWTARFPFGGCYGQSLWDVELLSGLC